MCVLDIDRVCDKNVFYGIKRTQREREREREKEKERESERGRKRESNRINNPRVLWC